MTQKHHGASRAQHDGAAEMTREESGRLSNPAVFPGSLKKRKERFSHFSIPKGPGVAVDDWYDTNAAGKAQGEVWVQSLLWWALRS